MASIGFTLGASAMVALDVTWSWVVILVGVLLGALLAFLAIVADLPTALLVALAAIAGAIAMTAGVMLIVGALETDDFTATAATERIKDDWWWYVVMIALAVAGLLSQVRTVESLRASLRSAWIESGGAASRV